jgi:cytochrome c oxidase subunit 4
MAASKTGRKLMSLTHSNDVPAPVADDVGPDDPHGVHAVPRRVLLGVYGLLILFTGVTVAASMIDLGQANIWVALAIALIKGGLVTMYFMHLRWDSPFNGMILIAALFFVSLFIGLALLDSNSYQPQLKPTPMATHAP